MNINREIAWRLDPSADHGRSSDSYADPWQAQLLRSQSSRACCCFAVVSAESQRQPRALALHTACFNDDALVLLVSPSERQSLELFVKVSGFYKRLRPVPAVKELVTVDCDLVNGSRVVALPGRPRHNPRLFRPVSWLSIDEACSCPGRRPADGASYPCWSRTTAGSCCCPRRWGARASSAKNGQSDDPAWERIAARASESPRISRGGARRTTGGPWYPTLRAGIRSGVSRRGGLGVQPGSQSSAMFADDSPDAGSPVWQDFYVGLDLGQLTDFTALTVMPRSRAINPSTGDPEQDSRGDAAVPVGCPPDQALAAQDAVLRSRGRCRGLGDRRTLPGWPILVVDRLDAADRFSKWFRSALAEFARGCRSGVSRSRGVQTGDWPRIARFIVPSPRSWARCVRPGVKPYQDRS